MPMREASYKVNTYKYVMQYVVYCELIFILHLTVNMSLRHAAVQVV